MPCAGTSQARKVVAPLTAGKAGPASCRYRGAVPRPNPDAARLSLLWRSLRGWLPRGGTLPPEEWDRRHRVLLVFLWLNVVALPLFSVVSGRYWLAHVGLHLAPLLYYYILYHHMWSIPSVCR